MTGMIALQLALAEHRHGSRRTRAAGLRYPAPRRRRDRVQV